MDNILIKIFLILAGLSLAVTTFIYAYANVSTVVDTFESDQPVQQAREALRNSTRIALEYPFITLKFLFLSFILQIRFVAMTLIVIGIPSVLIWLLMQIGIV